MDIFSVFSLLGGVALFLYGMHMLGEAIRRRAGGQLKNTLERLTSNPIKGIVLGAGVTALIQSSSATIVMVLGFINSGIMTLESSIGIIMGANVGTTITAWILSLTNISGTTFLLRLINPDNFVPILAFVGIIFMLFTKNDKKKEAGAILVGFAILMFGMSVMSDSMAPLSEDPGFSKILTYFSNPILGVLTGFLLAGIIQSSSASIGILQALSVTGSISYGIAIPNIMGQNIGACLVVLLSAVGSNRDAKRAAWIHLYFNIIGTVVFLILFYLCDWIFDFAFVNMPVNAVEIAIIHTVFKLASTLVLLPFTKQLVKLAHFTVKDSPVEEKFQMLDERFLSTPHVAIERCRDAVFEMAESARAALIDSIHIISDYDAGMATLILESEDLVDKYEDKIGSYLVKLSSSSLALKDSKEVSRLLHTIGDLERISDHAVNIMEVAQEMDEKRIQFSESAKEDLKVIAAALTEILNITIDCFEMEDLTLAYKVEPLEQVVDDLKDELKMRHIQRLRSGACTIELGFIFSDLITNYERVSDHCSNIAALQMQISEDNFDTHAYISRLKNTQDHLFQITYADYKKKYTLDSRVGETISSVKRDFT